MKVIAVPKTMDNDVRNISAIIEPVIMILLGLKPLVFKKKDWRDRLSEAEKGCDAQ